MTRARARARGWARGLGEGEGLGEGGGLGEGRFGSGAGVYHYPRQYKTLGGGPEKFTADIVAKNISSFRRRGARAHSTHWPQHGWIWT